MFEKVVRECAMTEEEKEEACQEFAGLMSLGMVPLEMEVEFLRNLIKGDRMEKFLIKGIDLNSLPVISDEDVKNMPKAGECREKCKNPLQDFCGDTMTAELMDMDDLPFYENPFAIKRVIFNNPATIVFWNDGEKTVVRCMDNVEIREKVVHGRKKKFMVPMPSENYSKEIGLAMCIAKKAFGNTGAFNDVFKAFIPEYEQLDSKGRSVGKTGQLSVQKEGKMAPAIEQEAKTDSVTMEEQEPENANDVCESADKQELKDDGSKKRKRVTELDVGKIKALSAAGWTAVEIAEEMNISVATVYNYIKAPKDVINKNQGGTKQ